MDDVNAYIGKTVLIGLTFYDAEGKKTGSDVGHGKIVRINMSEGIVVQIEPDGNEYKLPPDLNNLQEAPPGEYEESTTGIAVINPEFISFWEIHEVASNQNGGSSWKPVKKFEMPEVQT
jgi:hypothetical protein